MKVNEIRVKAQTTSGLPIADVTGLGWVKDAIEDICIKYPEAGKRTVEEVTINDITADYTFKKNLLFLKEVKDLDSSRILPSNSERYVLNDDNTITFNELGRYKLTYIALPDMPNTVNSEIPLPFLFIPCIEFYLAFKIRARLFGQADNTAISFYQQYQASLENAEIARRKQKIKKQMPPGRRW